MRANPINHHVVNFAQGAIEGQGNENLNAVRPERVAA